MRKNSTIILSSLVMLLCAFSLVVTLSYSWFTARLYDEASVTSIVAYDEKIIDQVSFYQYKKSDTLQPEGVYNFEKTPSDIKDLGKYSIIGSQYQILIEVTLTEYATSYSSFDVGAKSNASHYLGELDENGDLLTELQLNGNSLSSIVCFYAFDQSNISDEGDYYSLDLANTSNTSGSKISFVQDSHLISDGITMCNFTSTNKFFIVLDYDLELIEEIYSANLGNENISNMDNIAEDGNSYITYIADFYFYVQLKEGGAA